MPRYIDADALNAAIEKWFDGVCVYDVSPSEAVNDFQSIVDEQPTVSPDEVRGMGEWIKAHDDTVWWWECSVCHEPPLQRYKYDRLSNFCPNCGAKMEVSEDA